MLKNVVKEFLFLSEKFNKNILKLFDVHSTFNVFETWLYQAEVMYILVPLFFLCIGIPCLDFGSSCTVWGVSFFGSR